MKLCVALLDTMWIDTVRKAPSWFRINPHNRTGARLYKLVDGQYRLLATNACPYTVTSAKKHGKPDPLWVSDNLGKIGDRFGPIDLLLVCGNVAQQTYHASGVKNFPIIIRHTILMPHPAWRGWTKHTLDMMQKRIAEYARR